MMKFTIKSTDEYERLVKFFVENQLEFDGDEEVDTDILKCWKVTPVSYTHLDVYKRQILTRTRQFTGWPGCWKQEKTICMSQGE